MKFIFFTFGGPCGPYKAYAESRGTKLSAQEDLITIETYRYVKQGTTINSQVVV